MNSLLSSKIVGHPSQNGWGLVQDFTSPDLIKTHGRLITVISVKYKTPSPDPNEEVVLGRKILGRIQEEYFGKKHASPLDSLKNTVEKITQEFSQTNQTLDLLLASFIDNAVYVAAKGSVSSFVSRQGSLAQIAKSEGNKLVLVSGRPKEGDTFLFTTSNLLSVASLGVLKAALINSSRVSLSEVFAPLLHADQNLSNLASVALTIKALPKPDLDRVAINASPAPLTPKINAYRQAPIQISGIRRKLAALIDKIIGILPERKIFIRSEEDAGPNHKRQVAVSVGVMLLLLLGVSISFGIKQRSNKSAIAKYEGKLIQAQHDFNEAQSLSSLNLPRARELVLGAKTAVDDLTNQGVKDSRLTQLVSDVENGLGKIAGMYRQNASSYFDLSLQSSGFKGDDIGISEGRIAVLDKNKKVIISVNADTKHAEVAAGPDIMPTALALAVYSDRNFVLSDDGIWEVGDKGEVVVKKEWDGDVLVNAYSGNIYVLEKGKNIVWRFAGDGGTFGKKESWFGSGVSPDLSNVKAMSIDGSLWMLTASGRILKFSLGSPQEFSLKDMDKPISNPTDIFTNEETNFIYILDSQNSRVVVVDKNGVFKAQYLSDDLREATHIIVSEADKKIIFLEGPKLFSIDIKHL